MAEEITEGDKKLLEPFHALNVQPKIEKARGSAVIY